MKKIILICSMILVTTSLSACNDVNKTTNSSNEYENTTAISSSTSAPVNTPMPVSKASLPIKSLMTKTFTYGAAIKSDGSLWTWGYNQNGELGNGTRNNGSKEPIKVMDNVISVDSGTEFKVAIKSDSSLWAWGLGGHVVPEKILDDVKYVKVFFRKIFIIKNDNSLWGWDWSGSDSAYELFRRTPRKIMDNVATVSLGHYHSSAIKTDGTLWTWNDTREPVFIMDEASSVVTTNLATAALKSDGSVWTWGDNQNGELGDGTTINRNTPQKIMDDVVSIYAEGWTYAAIKTDGTLWVWGGDPSANNILKAPDNNVIVPTQIMNDVLDVYLDYCSCDNRKHIHILKTDGTYWAWGLPEEDYDNQHIVETMDDVKYLNLTQCGSSYYENNSFIKTDGSLWICLDAPEKIMDNIMLPQIISLK